MTTAFRLYHCPDGESRYCGEFPTLDLARIHATLDAVDGPSDNDGPTIDGVEYDMDDEWCGPTRDHYVVRTEYHDGPRPALDRLVAALAKAAEDNDRQITLTLGPVRCLSDLGLRDFPIGGETMTIWAGDRFHRVDLLALSTRAAGIVCDFPWSATMRLIVRAGR